MVALAACGNESVTPGTGDGTSEGSSGSLATTEAADESSGGDDGPSMACSDEVPTFIDPLRVIGSDEPGLSGLVSLVATDARVYGCSHDAGLVVWSVADPTSPTVVATGLTARGTASVRCDAVAMSDDGTQLVTTRHLVEGDGEGGVTVWDLTADPASPTMLAHWSTPLPVESAVLGSGRALVAVGTEGLRALALAGDQLIEQGTFVDEDSDARGLALVGDLLLVAEARGGLRVYDVAADDPVLRATAGLGAVALGVHLDGDRAYVATLEAVAIVDLSDPDEPELIVQLPTPGVALDVAQRGDLLLVADWDEISGVSLADPDAPQLLLDEPAPGTDPLDRARAVAIAGDLVVASGWRGLHVFELELEPEAPELQVESLRVDFRGLAAGDSDDHVVVLRNTGNATLSLCGIESTLVGVEIDASPAELEPGSTLAVEIAYTADSGAPIQGELLIHTNDPDQSLWTVPITVNTPRIGVGDTTLAFHHVDPRAERGAANR